MSAAEKEQKPTQETTDAKVAESGFVEVEKAEKQSDTQMEKREARETRSSEAEKEKGADTEEAEMKATKQAAKQAATTRVEKDPLTRQIEGVLQEGLRELYTDMSPKEKQAFRKKGQETVSKIHNMIEQAKVQAKSVFELIKDWLRLIPRVNRYYLKQEAKIKTDNILALARERQGEREEKIA